MENCYFDVLGILIHNISSEVIAGESLQSNGAKYLVDFKLDGKFEGLLIYHNYIAPLQLALRLAPAEELHTLWQYKIHNCDSRLFSLW